MTVNDVLELVNFHNGYAPQMRHTTMIMAGVFGALLSIPAVLMVAYDWPRFFPKLLVWISLFSALSVGLFSIMDPIEKRRQDESATDMNPTEALSELYGIEISNPDSDSRLEWALLRDNTSQTGYRATIDGEVRNLTIETIDGEYRITYVDPEHLVEVAPE